MDREKFVAAYLNSEPLPVNDLKKAREREQKKASMASRVPYPGTIDDIGIDTEEGVSTVRIYTPAGNSPFLPILYMHGGGFCIGSTDTSDNLCRALSLAADATLISVDYRLAPEQKFPGAIEECYRIAEWINDNEVALNVRADQLVLAGDSAGGNLAAALCLFNRGRLQLPIAHQILICPVLDQDTDHKEKSSPISDPILSTENVRSFSRHYFTDPQEAKHPLASPLLAKDLSGLPPATIITAGLDPLAEEGRRFAEKLREAGGIAKRLHYPEQVHDFPLFIRSLEDARGVVEEIALNLLQPAL